MVELWRLQTLFLCALTVPQVSALRDIVETWGESSGSFLPVPERRPGPKGDPGERGPPGKEVSGWWLLGGYALPRACSYSHKPASFSSHRVPSAFLESVG